MGPQAQHPLLVAGARASFPQAVFQFVDAHAFAKVDAPHARENAAQRVLNVTIQVTPGGRYQLGEIRVEGLQTIKESYVRRRLLIQSGVLKPGDTYAITCGEPMGYPGGTNMLKICQVG